MTRTRPHFRARRRVSSPVVQGWTLAASLACLLVPLEMFLQLDPPPSRLGVLRVTQNGSGDDGFEAPGPFHAMTDEELAQAGCRLRLRTPRFVLLDRQSCERRTLPWTVSLERAIGAPSHPKHANIVVDDDVPFHDIVETLQACDAAGFESASLVPDLR